MSQPIFQVKNLVKEFTVGGGFGKEEIFRALHGVSFDLYVEERWLWLVSPVAVKAPARG